MSWDADSFRAKHNNKLSNGQAAKAAKIANAMLKRGADEGVAIATANKKASAANRKAGAVKSKHTRVFGALG